MGIFEHFPYTNFHDLNLNWILQKVKAIPSDVFAAQKQLEPKTATGTARASGWVKFPEMGYYEVGVTIPGVADDSKVAAVVAGLGFVENEEVYNAVANAKIVVGEYSHATSPLIGALTLRAYGTAPTVDFPVNFIYWEVVTDGE